MLRVESGALVGPDGKVGTANGKPGQMAELLLVRMSTVVVWVG